MNLIKFVIFLLVPCLFSCHGNSSKVENSNNSDSDDLVADSLAALDMMLQEANKGGDKINVFLDAYFAQNPNSFDNDIQKQKTGKELHSLLKEKLKNNADFLSDIAVEFVSMDKVKSTDGKGYKYLVSFDRSGLSKTGEYNISFKIITALSEEEASGLKDYNKYYIKGDFVDFAEKKSFNIAAGVFDDNIIEIGGIFLKNVTIVPA